MERYELVEGKSSKFWEVGVDGSTLTVRYGRIGTDGQTKEKEFDTEAAATKERDKLVKEKTGKGYSLSDEAAAPAKPKRAVAPAPVAKVAEPVAEEPAAAETAPEPVVEAAPEPVAAPKPAAPKPAPVASGASARALDEMVAKYALPTRLRPGGTLDAQKSWAAMRELVLKMLPEAHKNDETRERAEWIEARLGETGPIVPAIAPAAPAEKPAGGAMGWLKSKLGSGEEPAAAPTLEAVVFGAEETREWVVNLFLASKATLPNHWAVKSPGQAARLAYLTHFAEWVVAAMGLRTLAEAANNLRPSEDRTQAYRESSWSSGIDLALRSAFAKAPEAEYDAVLPLFQRMVEEEQPSWRVRAFLAFILADDRPERHDLQPLAVLEGAEAAGEKVAEMPLYIPLVADCAPSAVAKWRAKRSYHLYLVYCEVGVDEVAATMIAAARGHGESPLPALDWLIHYGHETERTRIARMMLASGDDRALGLLTPMLHEKWIRAGLDEEAALDPENLLRQCVAALAGGRLEPALRGRVLDMAEKHGSEAVLGWVAADPKSQAWLEKQISAREVAAAPREAWPAVLRDPPWRRKKKVSDDIVLALDPIPTPFAFTPDLKQPERHSWYAHKARVLASLDELPALLTEIETQPGNTWPKIEPPSMPLPAPGSAPEHALLWLETRLNEIWRQSSWAVGSRGWDALYAAIEKQPEALALALWGCAGPTNSCHYYWTGAFNVFMERFGERAAPGFVGLVENDPIGMLELGYTVDTAEIAPLAARAFLKLKKARVPAASWMRRHRRTAMTRLIPDALGKKGAQREAAEHALRWLVTDIPTGREELEAIAADYAKTEPKVTEALAQVLDRDPLARFPAKLPKFPTWFSPSAVRPPELKTGGALSGDAIVALVEMLAFSTPDAVYAGVDEVKAATTPRSLADFAWDLFSAWLADGAPSKDGFAMRAVGWIGDDDCARQLTRLIRKWPGEAAHARAVTGLDVLVDIGSDVALMNLNGIAEKLNFKGLQEKAREKIAQLAEARDLTPEELSDRLAPDLDLDDRGGLDLVFGERKFRAGFDEFLKPWVKDLTGARLKDLPKPNKSDDPELSKEASARWSGLKKDARAVASLQITRLENMLSTSRRVKREVFWAFFAAHPLIRHLAQRLVWGIYGDDDPRSAPTTIFRVSDDLSVTDAADETLDIVFSDDEPGVIGLVHPLHLPDGGLDKWGALFGDYEISQPFPQLGRETYVLTDAEKGASEIVRFEGVKVEAARIRGMASKGWPLGSPQDAGVISWIERPVTFSDGKRETVSIDFEGGLFTGASEYEDKVQTLGKLSTYLGWYGRTHQANARTFGELDPVTASEMLRGPSLLAEARVA